MKHQRLQKAVLALIVGVSLAIGACTRSASTLPAPTGEAGATASGLTAQQATMESVRSALLTQTAQAGESGAPTATEAPTAGPTSALGETAVVPTATSAQLAPPTPGIPSTYTLKEGEFPYCIARRFNVDPSSLLAANGMTPSSAVSPGLTLTIPQDASPFPPPRALRSHPSTYTVQVGDTINSIACLFGDVDPNAIAAANGLSSPYTLTPGTVLTIP